MWHVSPTFKCVSTGYNQCSSSGSTRKCCHLGVKCVSDLENCKYWWTCQITQTSRAENRQKWLRISVWVREFACRRSNISCSSLPLWEFPGLPAATCSERCGATDNEWKVLNSAAAPRTTSDSSDCLGSSKLCWLDVETIVSYYSNRQGLCCLIAVLLLLLMFLFYPTHV